MIKLQGRTSSGYDLVLKKRIALQTQDGLLDSDYCKLATCIKSSLFFHVAIVLKARTCYIIP